MSVKNQIKEYSTYDALINHPFALSVLRYSARIIAVIEKPHTFLKTEAEYKRLPSKAEYYCLLFDVSGSGTD
jgi:hypothetical protein